MEILIADENPVSLIELRKMLEKIGHEVISAGDSKEALDIFQNRPVRIVFSDIMMQPVNGVELCQIIRETSKDHYTY